MTEGPHETAKSNGGERKTESLYSVLRRTAAEILFPDPNSESAPLLRRFGKSLADNAADLREASGNFGGDVLSWCRSGSPLRALLVITVGTIVLLTTMGLLVFMLFFLAATLNAIIIALLISLAAVGGFLALFFTFATAIYIGALAIAAFVISTAIISATVAVLVASGWIGFLWGIWIATKRSVRLAKQSLSVTGSAISAYSSARHARGHREIKIE